MNVWSVYNIWTGNARGGGGCVSGGGGIGKRKEI